MIKNKACHPGSFIREELKIRGWSQSDLSCMIGWPVYLIDLLIIEKRDITPDISKLLGVAFSVSSEFFMNLQEIYDLSKGEQLKRYDCAIIHSLSAKKRARN